METISLRRTKDKGLIGLPPKTIETCFVDLSVEERDLYDQLEEKAKNFIKDYISDGSLMRNYSVVLGILLRLRQICNDTALCPTNLKLFLPSCNIEGKVLFYIYFSFSFLFLLFFYFYFLLYFYSKPNW